MNTASSAGGLVVSVHRVERRDAPALELETASFRADFGLEGDWRSRPGRGRQVTLIEAEALDEVATTLGLEAVPAGASRRQIVVRGLRLDAAAGKHLRVGPMLVAVHGPCDPCANMERSIGSGARRAMEGRGGICASVVVGGTVRRGDTVAVVP